MKRSKMVTDPSSRVSKAKRILGYSFVNPSLLEEALTHPSFSNAGAISYERLEFVGDAALNLAWTKHFYLSCLDIGPGQLSKLRSANLCNENLARVAVRHGLYRPVLCNNQELDRQVEEFTKAVKQDPKNDQIHRGTTNKAPKVLADVVESIAAALYEDSSYNLDMIWKVLRRLLEPLITTDTFDKKPVTNAVRDEKKAKKKLNECCMKRHWPLPVYKLKKKKDLNHSRKFICSVNVQASDDNIVVMSEYRSRVKDAERSAALNMLKRKITKKV